MAKQKCKQKKVNVFKEVGWEADWEKVCSINGGSQAKTYKVRHRKNASMGVLKVLEERPSISKTKQRYRFYNEALAITSLEGLNVPTLIQTNADKYESDVKLYMITAYIDGKQLNDYIQTNGNDSLLTKVIMALELVNILVESHDRNIVHRDIKPGNIIITNEKELYLVDFGISKNIAIADEVCSKTHLGEELGNRYFRPPEYSQGSESKSDPRSDLTAAAAILFHLVVGCGPKVMLNEREEYPHERAETVAKLHKVLTPTSFPVIMRIFHKTFNSLTKRYSEGLEMLEDLHELILTIRYPNPPPQTALELKTLVDYTRINYVPRNSHVGKLIKLVWDTLKERHSYVEKETGVITMLEGEHKKENKTATFLFGLKSEFPVYDQFISTYEVKVTDQNLVISHNNNQNTFSYGFMGDQLQESIKEFIDKCIASEYYILQLDTSKPTDKQMNFYKKFNTT